MSNVFRKENVMVDVVSGDNKILDGKGGFGSEGYCKYCDNHVMTSKAYSRGCILTKYIHLHLCLTCRRYVCFDCDSKFVMHRLF